jgi:hypothetical protein
MDWAKVATRAACVIGIPGGFCGMTPPGTRTVLGPTVRRPPTSSRQLTVRVSSFSHHQPAVMAITKWSIQAPSSKKSPAEAAQGWDVRTVAVQGLSYRRFRGDDLRAEYLARLSSMVGSLPASCPRRKRPCRRRAAEEVHRNSKSHVHITPPVDWQLGHIQKSPCEQRDNSCCRPAGNQKQ